MRWTPRAWTLLAASSGFISVAAGAFGAHGASDPAARELLRTGASYEMTHALAALVCAALVTAAPMAGVAVACFLGGSLLFCGSLYALAFGAPRWVGAVTPAGGLLFLAGWLCLGWAALSARRGSVAGKD